jgi:type IV pilus assembly protein PilY1
MKLIKVLKILLVIFCSAFLLLSQNAFANDTDLYLSSGQGVEPNILIIFDNSGSMAENVPAPAYYNDHGYAIILANLDPPIVPQVSDANKNVVYYYKNGSYYQIASDISQVQCAAAKTGLTTYGYWQGKLNSNSNTNCGNTTYTLRTGNYRDYLQYQTNDPSFSTPKIQVAKNVINDFIDNVDGIKLGVMIFNSSEGGKIQNVITDVNASTRTTLHNSINAIQTNMYTPLAETLYEAGIYYKGGSSYFNHGVVYTSPIQYSCQRNYVIIITDGDSTQDQNPILKTITNGFPGKSNGDMDGDGWEPGCKNAKTYYDCSSCSPSCAYPNCPNNNSCCQNLQGSDYLDDVANYLYQTDLRSDLDGTQNIITYTIGFTVSSQWNLLERTAQYGHGKYYFCEDAQGLATSFQNVIADILAKSSSFVAPIVPVSQVEKSTAGDKIYLALFKPQRDGMWKGNIKKFGIAQPKGVTSDCPYNAAFNVGDILDANCNQALDLYGQFYDTAKSYWATNNYDNDGGEVENGGVGELLLDRVFSTDARSIYTYFGSNVTLTDNSNKFSTANIKPSQLGLGSDTDPAAQTARDQLVNYVYGYDAYGSIPGQKRDWVLGSFLHSRPFIINNYNGSITSVIYAGSNDGMLHAFDASNGRELWAFVPPSVWLTLQGVHLDVNQIFVDGSPKAYIKADPTTGQVGGTGTQAILIFGLRRGGNRYTALDVTNPTAPKFLWEIGPNKTVYMTTTNNSNNTYNEMGQSWSNPKIGIIDDGTAPGKTVFFIGGGYDTYEDNDNPDPTQNPNPVGRAVYIVDVLNGNLVKGFSHSDASYSSTMIYSIPSDITPVDTDGDGKIDRLYVGDMGGQMWRFDIKGSNTGSWNGKRLFKSNPGGDASTGRKIFYPPDVSLESEAVTVSGHSTITPYEMVYFATGDREHPKSTSVVDRIYAVKDRNPAQPVTEDASLLVDVTQDLLQEPGTSVATLQTIRSQLTSLNGWFIKLNQNSGEKSLSSAVIFYGVVYYTTFTPTSTGVSVTDPCYVGEGQGRVYMVEWNTGNAVFDTVQSNNVTAHDPELNKDRLYFLRRADRVDTGNDKITGIPSEPIVTFIQGISVGYIGVSAGVQQIGLKTTKSLVPIYWNLKGGQ